MSWDGWASLFTEANALYLLRGLLTSLHLAGLGIGIGIVGGSFIALWQTILPGVWSWPAVAFVTFFRSIPLLVGVFFIAFGLPVLGITFPPFTSAVIGISIYNSAMVGEGLRGAITSVSRSQLEAGLAQGFSRLRAYWLIIFPQAWIRAIPIIFGQAIVVLQGTALVSAIGTVELTGAAQNLYNRLGNPLEAIILIGFIYYLLDAGLAALRDLLSDRVRAQLGG